MTRASRAAVLVATLVACTQPWPPPRPAAVPEQAVWIGPQARPTPTPTPTPRRTPDEVWWPTPKPSTSPSPIAKEAPGWIRCEDADPSNGNSYRCHLYSVDGRHLREARLVLIRNKACDCPLSFVEPSWRRVQAKQLQYLGYDSERERVVLNNGDALVEVE